MIYTMTYTEVSVGKICFEADSPEEAKKLAEALSFSKLTEGELKGAYRNEDYYRLTVAPLDSPE